MLEIAFPSKVEYLSLVDAVCEAFCAWIGLSKKVADDISIAVIEASTNAIVHGNKSDTSKKVNVSFEKKDPFVTVIVRDEGQGFDPSTVGNPVDEANLLKESGRGIYIMKAVMDEVEFDFPKTGGTRVVMRKCVDGERKPRVLCVDYGEKRFGLAVSDELGVTAQPVGFIETDEDVHSRIRQIATNYGVGEIVVGLPLDLTGKIGDAASRVVRFARELRRKTGLPVATWDERLSTKESAVSYTHLTLPTKA